MRHIAIIYSTESEFSLFETAMRTTADLEEYVKNVSHTCLWGKILTADDGNIVAEWKAPNNYTN